MKIKVERLPERAALEMFLAIMNRCDVVQKHLEAQSVPVRTIKELDHFPSAIAQAASFLRVYNTITDVDYLTSPKDEADRLKLLSLSSDYENYNKTVMTTWELSCDALVKDRSSPYAARLLCVPRFPDSAGVLLKYLHGANEDFDVLSERGLRPELLEDMMYLKDSLDCKISFHTLVELSLVHRSQDWTHDIKLNLHPLVHEWVRVRILRDCTGLDLRD